MTVGALVSTGTLTQGSPLARRDCPFERHFSAESQLISRLQQALQPRVVPRPTPAALPNLETPEKTVKNIVRSERLKLLLFVNDSEPAEFLDFRDDDFLMHFRSPRARQGTVAALVRRGGVRWVSLDDGQHDP